MENEIKEGDEYTIIALPSKRIVYTGIAESDTEAKERLEQHIMYMRLNSETTERIQLKIEKVS